MKTYSVIVTIICIVILFMFADRREKAAHLKRMLDDFHNDQQSEKERQFTSFTNSYNEIRIELFNREADIYKLLIEKDSAILKKIEKIQQGNENQDLIAKEIVNVLQSEISDCERKLEDMDINKFMSYHWFCDIGGVIYEAQFFKQY